MNRNRKISPGSLARWISWRQMALATSNCCWRKEWIRWAALGLARLSNLTAMVACWAPLQLSNQVSSGSNSSTVNSRGGCGAITMASPPPMTTLHQQQQIFNNNKQAAAAAHPSQHHQFYWTFFVHQNFSFFFLLSYQRQEATWTGSFRRDLFWPRVSWAIVWHSDKVHFLHTHPPQTCVGVRVCTRHKTQTHTRPTTEGRPDPFVIAKRRRQQRRRTHYY